MQAAGGSGGERPGSFTFLFSDIEGSTRLLAALGTRGPEVITRHNEILGKAIEAHGGVVRRIVGDSFFATFTRPSEAVLAAVLAQRQLAEQTWPVDDGVRVRMGVHTGEAVEVANELVGIDIHRAARIMSIGWGGQILVSDVTARLLGDAWPDASLLDLGKHHLKDFAEPERIRQVNATGLRATFPALRSIDAVTVRLPRELTTFVGRERELADICRLVGESKVLTLTGPGGTGKTRLSIQAASVVADQFPDGVHFVALASVTDPALVLSAVSDALGLHPAGQQQPLDVVIDHLGDQRVLLVLDNFEQVLPAAVDVSKLVAQATRTTVLITSRAALRITGEQEYPVSPLSTPNAAAASFDDIADSEAVTLFVTRASAVRPDFRLTEQNAAAVLEVARRLDGLPLAIELAAARVKVLSVEAIGERLGGALDLLSSGERDRPERQRTLRGAIAWSHDLLSDPAKSLFARLAIFRGGADLEQIEDIVVGGDVDDLFEALTELVDQSLVRRTETLVGSRFLLLETIREFAEEKLAERGERDDVSTRHAAAFVALAETGARADELAGPERRVLLDRIEADHDNLRAALRRSIEGRDTPTALRLVGALWRMWQIRGHLLEARRNADAVLALPDVDDHAKDLADAREAAGGIAYWQGDFETARDHYDQALRLRRELGDAQGIARGLYNLGFTQSFFDRERADAEMQQAVEAFLELGDESGAARTHWGLAVNAFWAEDYDAVWRHLDACLPSFRAAGQSFDLAWALHMKGMAALGLQDWPQARGLFEEALEMFLDADDVSGIYLVLGDFAALAQGEGDPERGLRLRGYVEQLGDDSGTGLLLVNRELVEQYLPAIELDSTRQAALLDEGRRLTRAQALELARVT